MSVRKRIMHSPYASWGRGLDDLQRLFASLPLAFVSSQTADASSQSANGGLQTRVVTLQTVNVSVQTVNVSLQMVNVSLQMAYVSLHATDVLGLARRSFCEATAPVATDYTGDGLSEDHADRMFETVV